MRRMIKLLKKQPLPSKAGLDFLPHAFARGRKYNPGNLFPGQGMLFLFFFVFLSLTSCVEVDSSSSSKVYVERDVSEQTIDLEAAKPTTFEKEVPTKTYLELEDKSKLVLYTLQLDIFIQNPSDKEIILTKLCTKIYDFFHNEVKKDVWFTVAPLAPGGEKHLKRNIYTEPTQSRIPKYYVIEICGAEYGKSISS